VTAPIADCGLRIYEIQTRLRYKIRIPHSAFHNPQSIMPDWKLEIRDRLQSLQLTPAREAAIVEELAQYLDDYSGSRIDLWAPLATEPLMQRPSLTSSAGYKWLQLVGRLKPGVSLDRARADLDTLFRPAVIEPELALRITPEIRRGRVT
jgi:hypothetical protein